MRRHRIIVFALVVLLALTVYQVSARPRHVSAFNTVRQLPTNMIAGSTYEWEVRFVNPKSENASMTVTLQITEEKNVVGLDEFSVEGTLEAYDNPTEQYHQSTITFTETEGGIFQNQISITERFNHITLTISSVPNLMPGTYTFTLTVTLQFED